MPVYNTGCILYKTIDSVLNQTFSDFELLLVDDGSTDASPSICEEYALKDKRVKVYHKQNGGICEARNFGLAKCSGQFVAFCDHDDLFEPQLLEKAYLAAVDNCADLVKFRYKEICESTEYVLEGLSDNILVFDNLKDNLYELNSIGYFGTIWSFLYRADWLKATGMCFDTSLKHGGEDYDFNMNLVPYIHKMVVLPDVLYLHFIRGSLSTSAKMYEDIMLHFLTTQKLLNNVAYIIGCEVKDQAIPFVKYYGQCVLNFVSGAVKLKKSYGYINQKLLDFRDCDIIKKHLSFSLLLRSVIRSPKETGLYLLSLMHLNHIIVFVYKLSKKC